MSCVKGGRGVLLQSPGVPVPRAVSLHVPVPRHRSPALSFQKPNSQAPES